MRKRLHRDIVEEYLSRQPDIEADGKGAIITAGPPGSGTSTALQKLRSTLTGYRTIDSDPVKEMIITSKRVSVTSSTYSARNCQMDTPIHPAELASLVHVESTLIADTILSYA